ncbi:MAG: ABC transporter ATP-binding protein [Candidatus Schekmanbacteria bacterium]|nr:MAG: ABC transporter ATP-binding protein [Candidatus Schekmanbacteria bacterium]
MKVIELKGVGKKYKIYHERPMLVKSLFTGVARRKKMEEFWALKNVNIEINKGEAAGIIGDNGAGKSTILKILSGVTAPTTGRVSVSGRIAGLLELGAGFHHDLTGRENVFLNGSILGLSKREIEEKFDSIVDFAGIKDFIDTPLRNYSSGMFVRLGFAVAVHVNPEILLVDEVLAVGDQSFQAKCLKTIENFLKEGNTLVFVSHDLNIIRHICSRVILMEKGEVVLDGEPSKVISRYWLSIGDKKGIGKIETEKLKIILNNGRLILLWNDIELTKGLSGYTSMRSFVKWYDSTVAEWRITENTETQIKASGEWMGLPLIQHWTVSFNEGWIEWDIEMEVKAPVDILKQQANIMLSEDYDRWIAEGGYSGIFPKFREETDDDWDRLWTAESSSVWIGAEGKDNGETFLPTVKFCADSLTGKERINIVNSNTFYRGRVLQQLRENDEATKRYEPGRYHYFSGKIRIE